MCESYITTAALRRSGCHPEPDCDFPMERCSVTTMSPVSPMKHGALPELPNVPTVPRGGQQTYLSEAMLAKIKEKPPIDESLVLTYMHRDRTARTPRDAEHNAAHTCWCLNLALGAVLPKLVRARITQLVARNPTAADGVWRREIGKVRYPAGHPLELVTLVEDLTSEKLIASMANAERAWGDPSPEASPRLRTIEHRQRPAVEEVRDRGKDNDARTQVVPGERRTSSHPREWHARQHTMSSHEFSMHEVMARKRAQRQARELQRRARHIRQRAVTRPGSSEDTSDEQPSADTCSSAMVSEGEQSSLRTISSLSVWHLPMRRSQSEADAK